MTAPDGRVPSDRPTITREVGNRPNVDPTAHNGVHAGTTMDLVTRPPHSLTHSLSLPLAPAAARRLHFRFRGRQAGRQTLEDCLVAVGAFSRRAAAGTRTSSTNNTLHDGVGQSRWSFPAAHSQTNARTTRGAGQSGGLFGIIPIEWIPPKD